MQRKTIILAISALALLALACSFTVNVPDLQRVQVGPTITEDVVIPALEDSEAAADLRLEFGAGELEIQAGEGPELVTGTARYNVRDLKPEVSYEGNRVRLTNGDFEFSGIPDFNDYINEWNLSLGESPISLRISAGAYRASYDFGGVSLRELRITDGAADVELSFSSPNPEVMALLRYETGASSVSLRELANANFEEMVFRSGAGDYKLDFSGELQRDASVDIRSGLSSLEIIVPEGTDTRVSFSGGLTNISTRGDWRQSGGDYFLDGSGPTLQITIEMGAGNITLSNR
jgi:hypothetical protein